MKHPKNVVINKGCHSRSSSRRVSVRDIAGIYNARRYKTKENALLNRYVEDPRQKHSGMTTNFTTARGFTARAVIPQGRYAGYSGRTAFTLIELLVVVLIIGILAAVALPQYQFAVAKSHATQTWVRMNALIKATNLYVLANGTWPTDVRNLDIEIAEANVTYGSVGMPITNWGNHYGIIYSNGDKCAVYLAGDSKEITCYNGDFLLVSINGQPIKWCQAYTRAGEKICKSLSSSGKTDYTYGTGFHRWIVD